MGSEIPKINFSGLDFNTSPISDRWNTVRDEVMAAFETHGFFQAAINGELSLERQQLDEIFSHTLEELFSAPMERKLQIESLGGQGFTRYPSVEVLTAEEPCRLESVQSLIGSLWLQGDQNLSKKLWNVGKPLAELELMIRRMVFDGLHIGKHYSSHVESTRQMIRFQKYEPPVELAAHTNASILSIVYQHQYQGLEIQAKEGQWLQMPNYSFTIITGDALKAMTNGRLKPAVHRVKSTINDRRYSINFGSQFKDGCKVQVLQEFVDEKHPQIFKPYDIEAYWKYLMSGGAK